MDPNETLKQIHKVIRNGEDITAADQLCWDLWGWLRKDGFEPDWGRYPLGTAYYDVRCCYMVKLDDAKKGRQ